MSAYMYTAAAPLQMNQKQGLIANIRYINTFEERSCVGQPQQGANQYGGEIGTRVGYQITYYCNTGFQLLNGRHQSVIECTDNDGRDPKWSSSSLPDCVGKQRLFYAPFVN